MNANNPIQLTPLDPQIPLSQIQKPADLEDSRLTNLGAKPGLKQGVVFAIRDYQESVASLFKGNCTEDASTSVTAPSVAASGPTSGATTIAASDPISGPTSGPTSAAATAPISSSKPEDLQAQDFLAEFAAKLPQPSAHYYNKLTPETRQLVASAYEKGALFVNDPQTHLFLERLSAILQVPLPDGNEKFLNDMVQGLFTGNLDVLILVQEHIATAEVSSISESAYFDDFISNVIQKTRTGEDLEKCKIKHALRICARQLCADILPILGLNKTPGVLFDAKTIKALMTHPKIKIKTLDIVLGQVMILQHQLTPFPNLEKALKEVGVQRSPEEISAYFSQGVKSSQTIDQLLNTLTGFAKSMGKNDTLKHMMSDVLDNSPEVWFERYQDHLFARQLGVGGLMAGTSLDAHRHLFAEKLDLSAAKQKHSKVAGIVIPGRLKDAVKGVFTTAPDFQKLVTQFNTYFDLQKARQQGLNTLSKQTPASKVDQAKQKEKTKQLEKEIAVLEGKLVSTYRSAAKTFQPMVELIRLGIMKIVAGSPDIAKGISQIQNGLKESEIEAFLADYGLNSAAFANKGLTDPHPIRALIARECKQFSGLADFAVWTSKARISKQEKETIALKDQMMQRPEIREALGLDLKGIQLAKDRISTMQPGQKFALNWGKSVIFEVPESVKLAEEAFLGGVAGGVTAEARQNRQFWVEKIHTEAGSGFNVYLGKEFGAKVGLNVDFVGGMVKSYASAGQDVSHGFRIHFKSESSASDFISSIMNGRVDAPALGQADLVFVDKGHVRALSAGVSFQLPNPLEDVMPQSETAYEGLNDEVNAFTSNLSQTGISISATHEKSRNTSLNIHETGLQKSSQFNVSLDTGIFKKIIYHAAKHVQGESFKEALEMDLSEGDLSVTVNNTRHMTSKSGFLHHAAIDKTMRMNVAALSPKLNQRIAFSMLKGTDSPHLKTPEGQEKLTAFLSCAESGDSLRAHYELNESTKWTICDLTDKASPNYDPKKAKELLSDMKNYSLTSVRLIREKSHSETTSILKTVMVDKVRQTSVSQEKVVAELRLDA